MYYVPGCARCKDADIHSHSATQELYNLLELHGNPRKTSLEGAWHPYVHGSPKIT